LAVLFILDIYGLDQAFSPHDFLVGSRGDIQV